MQRDSIKYQTIWTICRYLDDDAYERRIETWVPDGATGILLRPVSIIPGNVLLNAGIALALDLLIGAGGTAYNNSNSYIGVGDSATGEGPTDAALLASTNKFWRPMETSYPIRSNQTVTWRAVFGSSEAVYHWQEFTVVNASSDTGVNLNRKTSDQGTKAGGQTWTLDLAITLS